MRAVVEVEEDQKGATILVVTELPYQVNPDNLVESIAALVKDGKIGGIRAIHNESSDRIGMRIVITLSRDAVAKVVLNNLFKHTQLQTTFGANMLAIVDGVPRTLRLDQFVTHYVEHQIEVIVRRTQYRLRKAEERAHILRALLKALDQLDAVIALIRNAPSADDARGGLMRAARDRRDPGDRDPRPAAAPAGRAGAQPDHRRGRRDRGRDRRPQRHPGQAGPAAARSSATSSNEIVDEVRRRAAHPDHPARRRRLDGGPHRRRRTSSSRSPAPATRSAPRPTSTGRSGAAARACRAPALQTDDIVAHFFVTSTHDWILFFTNKGRVYRAKAYELPEANRNARGQHVANLLAFQPDETIAEVITLKNYEVSPYLVLATKHGLVKKTKLTDFDSNRTGGIVAINLREDDELIDAALISAEDDLLLVSRKAMSIRFTADDDALRPMGRATSGVIGMRFNAGDELLAMEVVRDDRRRRRNPGRDRGWLRQADPDRRVPGAGSRR